MEAADLQWWWRTPRESDTIDQVCWIDDEGPVAGVVLTEWGRAWGCDLIVVPGVTAVPVSTAWGRAVAEIEARDLDTVEVLVADNDAELIGVLAGTGLVADERSGITWMDAANRAAAAPLPEGFVLVDRAVETSSPHPMRVREAALAASAIIEGKVTRELMMQPCDLRPDDPLASPAAPRRTKTARLRLATRMADEAHRVARSSSARFCRAVLGAPGSPPARTRLMR